MASTPPLVGRLPPDGRLAELARLGPVAWYADHAVNSLTCACDVLAPAPDCDRGHALYRVSKRHAAGETWRPRA